MTNSTGDTAYSMVLVMGLTGSGKSYFINRLAAESVVEGEGLKSETEACQVVRVGVGRHRVAIVDTPGFDDSKRTDTEILEEIVQFLCTQYELGIPLKGIVYMHRITDNKMSGSAQRYLEMFKRICGDKCMANVVLLTTMWSYLSDEAVGLRRERELREEFWNVMESNGSTIRSFDGSRAMAEAFICRLMRKPDIVLDIQQELVDQGKRLDETFAGKLIVPRLESLIEESSDQIRILDRALKRPKDGQVGEERRRLADQRAALDDQRQKNIRNRQRLKKRPGREVQEKIEEEKGSGKWKDTVAVFASLLGLAITATVNVILPLAGVISF